MHDIAIRNAKILRDGSWENQDLAIENERFVEYATSGARREIDAQGMSLIPGSIDLHVHFNEPGRTHWEGFATGSLSAVAGGNTFVAEMPLNSIPSTVSVKSLHQKLDAIANQSHLDFGLWGGLVPGNVSEIRALSKAGVIAFKAFMSPSGTDDFSNSDIETLRSGMREIATTGKFLAVHAEDPVELKRASASLSSRKSAYDWERSRPIEAELNAVSILIELAVETACPLHIVHVSNRETLELIAKAKSEGVPISCETCPHYLLLTVDDAHQIGPAAKCAPPLRGKESVLDLWRSLRINLVDTIGSDHSPCSPDLKEGKAFFDAWGGISGLQHGLPLLWTEAFDDPQLFSILLDLSCSNPSKLAALSRKGSLAVGNDADFVLLKEAPAARPIEESDLHYRHRQSAYCGRSSKLLVAETWLRGERIYGDGKPLALPKGRFTPLKGD